MTSEQELLEFGQRLKAMRERRTVHQAQLAMTAGVSWNAIVGYESGKRVPVMDEIEKIAKCLGCSVDYLLGPHDPGDTQTIQDMITKDELSQVIGTRLQRLRKSKGYKQREAAEALRISQQALNSYENGRRIPCPAILVSLADFYGVSLDYIYGRVDARNQMVANDSALIITPKELNDLTENLRMAEKALTKLYSMGAILTHIQQVNDNTPD